MNNHKNALACAVAATLGAAVPAQATQYNAVLSSVVSYSNNGTSAAILTSSTATFKYDDVTNLLTQTGGTYVAQYRISPATLVFRHTITGLVIGNGAAASATTYDCIEGNFGPVVGASLCGNYNFGPNVINESTTTWGPGSTAFSRALGGDDVALGTQQNIDADDGFTATSFDGTTLVLYNGAIVGTGATVNSGFTWTLATTAIVPDAVDDGPVAVTEGATVVIPVGANDLNFTDPSTITITTPPAHGTITTFSSPGAPAGMTITYTADVGSSSFGTDSFVYQLADTVPGSDTATVSLTIDPVVDTVPDAFPFVDKTDVALNTTIASDPVTIAGINSPATITVVGGEYSINGGAFTAVDGTVNAGDTVAARVLSSANPAEATSVGVVIGGLAETFSVTTEAADTIPDAFAFTAQTGVDLNTPIVSNAITVVGINVPTAISIVGGEYAINGGAYTTTAGNVNPGQTVTVRQTSSPAALTSTDATLTIGGTAGTFTVTTKDASDLVLVIDGGSSALDPVSLGFLGSLPLLLRRRRKAASKLAMALATVGVASAGGLGSGTADAADNDRWDWKYDGLYLGAGVNGTSLKSDLDLQDLANELGLTAGSGQFEDFPVGGQAYIGWMFNQYWGIEGRYSDTSDGESDIKLRNPDTGEQQKIGDAKISLDGWTAYVVGNWPVAPRWDLFGKVGYTWQNADAKVSVDGAEGSASASSNESDNGVAAAIGARWRFAHHWAATVEGEYLGVDFDNSIDEPWRYSANIEYWFGGHELPAPAPPPPARVAAVPPPPPPPPAAPKDSDGDGVVDAQDQCPETPRGDRVGSVGCSCDVTRQLQFKFGSAELTDADKQTLDEMAENLTRLHFVSGTIEGYTDSVGSDAFNQGLSERRAKTVATYLEGKGITADRMQVVGRGEADPIGDNKTAEGRAMNRRVVAKRTDCDKQ